LWKEQPRNASKPGFFKRINRKIKNVFRKDKSQRKKKIEKNTTTAGKEKSNNSGKAESVQKVEPATVRKHLATKDKSTQEKQIVGTQETIKVQHFKDNHGNLHEKIHAKLRDAQGHELNVHRNRIRHRASCPKCSILFRTINGRRYKCWKNVKEEQAFDPDYFDPRRHILVRRECNNKYTVCVRLARS